MPKWQAVEETLLEYQANIFGYGPASDCGAFLCAYAKRAGVLIPVKIPSRSTKIGAGRALRRMGFSTMSDLLTAHFQEVAPLEAKTGDFAAIPSADPNDPACGLVSAGRVFVLSDRGTVDYPRRQAVHAWRAECHL